MAMTSLERAFSKLFKDINGLYKLNKHSDFSYFDRSISNDLCLKTICK